MDWNKNKLIKKVSHEKFKDFSKEQLAIHGFYKSAYVAFVIGFGFAAFVVLGYAVSIVFFAQDFSVLIQVGLGVLFCFTVLIVLHELLHALAYKLVGAKKIYFGAIISRFLFYAGSDQEEFNGVQYRFIALFPFLTILGFGLFLVLLRPEYISFVLIVMFIHALFCGGDFAVVNFIRKHDLKKIHTYDSRDEEETYFYFKEAQTDI